MKLIILLLTSQLMTSQIGTLFNKQGDTIKIEIDRTHVRDYLAEIDAQDAAYYIEYWSDELKQVVRCWYRKEHIYKTNKG